MARRKVDGMGLNTVPCRNAARVTFCLVRSDGAVRTLCVGARFSGSNNTWWVKWDVPQAIGFVAVTFDDDISIFYDVDIVFCEYCGAIVATDLVNGDEGSSF